MRMTDLIAKKRDGGSLCREELKYFVRGAADGSLPDYQLSAMLMAIYFKGLDDVETTDMTLEMAESGEMLDLSDLGDKTVDKHSTGGVGDKTTLIVAPVAATLGCTVAKMSGRGLGHTGGTIDKLEAIPGFRTSLSPDEFTGQVKSIGLCVIGHSGNLAPADKRLYALRDVTATVDCLPLIASSIMSKKIAAGTKNIVLDVKYGSGAFMKTPEAAEALARKMVTIGKNAGRNVSAVITDMDVPLGHAVGNSLEVAEAVEVLQGGGPEDLKIVSIALAGEMYRLCFGGEPESCQAKVKEVLQNGSAFQMLCRMVGAQGGDISVIKHPERFAKATASMTVTASTDGYITRMDSSLIGEASVISGAGRETKDDIIDPAAGLMILKKTGDAVKKEEPLAVIYGDESRIHDAAEALKNAYRFGETQPESQPLIHEIIR